MTQASERWWVVSTPSGMKVVGADPSGSLPESTRIVQVVPAARVAQLESEIAELKQKLASDQMWIREISGSVKAGLWEPFLQSSLSAGIAHGRAISTSLEREARTQKLLEALEKIADPRKRHKEPDAYTELGCVMNIADHALAEYRGEIPESGEEE